MKKKKNLEAEEQNIENEEPELDGNQRSVEIQRQMMT